MSTHPVVNYDPVEEKINFISHAIGAGLALIAGILLIIKGSYLETAQWIGLWVYALSLFLLFAASSLYHFAESPELRGWYKKIRSHCHLLSDCRHLHSIFVYRTAHAKSPLPTHCTLGDCTHWYTIQVSFHSSL